MPDLEAGTLDWLKKFGVSDNQLKLHSMQFAKPTSPCEIYMHCIKEEIMVCCPSVTYVDTTRPECRTRKESTGQG